MVVSNIFYVHPYLFGEDEPILTSIFLRWVGKNHQPVLYTHLFHQRSRGFCGSLTPMVFPQIIDIHILGSDELILGSRVVMAGPPTYPTGNMGFIAGLTEGNQWLISPDHKGPRLFLAGGVIGLLAMKHQRFATRFWGETGKIHLVFIFRCKKKPIEAQDRQNKTMVRKFLSH